MQSREEIVTGMCYSMRHDYGLDLSNAKFLSSGMTQEERKDLFNLMAQVYDTNIAPNMDFKKV